MQTANLIISTTSLAILTHMAIRAYRTRTKTRQAATNLSNVIKLAAQQRQQRSGGDA